MSSAPNNPTTHAVQFVNHHSPTLSTTPPGYESPSPPSTKSSEGPFDTYGAIDTAPHHSADGSMVVRLPQHPTRPLSPIPSQEELHSDHLPSKYSVDQLQESAHLLSPDLQQQLDVEEVLRSHETLLHDRELYELRERELVEEHRTEARNICLFLCSFLCILVVTFIVIIAGLTELHAQRDMLKLKIHAGWPDGGIIPLKYGCHAPNGNPQSFPLTWENVPPLAKSLVVLFANPSAIRTKRYDPVHWFVTDVPVTGNGENSLPANASLDQSLLPAGTKQRTNAFDKTGLYHPPCAKNGTSFYVIHVYAVEASPVIEDFRDAREIIMRFVGVPYARITGVYGKSSGIIVPDNYGNLTNETNSHDSHIDQHSQDDKHHLVTHQSHTN